MTAIRVEKLHKSFRAPRPGAASTLTELVTAWRWRGRTPRRVVAPAATVDVLRGISFTLDEGRTLGVVGVNGAGKTTLLRLVAGVLQPDAGSIRTLGRVAALLELGAGFHPELTGRESAVLAAVIAGMSRRAARQRLDTVVEFAGLTGAIDLPLRTYSAGMQARLAFAVALEHEPEVLLVDEVLAVGDAAFQQRCLGRLRELQRAGVTMMVVSHDADLTRALCDDAIWLHDGVVAAAGGPESVMAAYERKPAAESPSAGDCDLVRSVEVLDDRGRPRSTLTSGSSLLVRITVHAPRALGELSLALTVTRDDGLLCIDTGTSLPADRPNECELDLQLARIDLAPGSYWLGVGVYPGSWGPALEERARVAPLRIAGSATTAATAPPATWTRRPAGSGHPGAAHLR